MQRKPPCVSVIMPVLGPEPDYFAQAVASVLKQSLTDLELIVIEDPSPSEAAAVLERFADPRIRHIRNSCRTSFCDQLNQGLAESQGQFIARMDADDICEPDRLEKQVARLRSDPKLTVVGSQIAVINSTGELIGYRSYPAEHEAIVAAMERYSPLAHPAVTFRKEAIVAVGGYRSVPFGGTEDYDLWCRLADHGCRFANLPQPLLRYRIHPQAMKSARLRQLLRGTLAIKEQYWRGRMSWWSQMRMWGERMLLWLPPRLVLTLFLQTHYRRRL